MRRVHCSPDPLTVPLEGHGELSADDANDLEVLAQHPASKPVGYGFWYGFEGSWVEYCAEDEYRQHWLGTFRYEVILRPEARVLTVDSVQRFLAFEKKYGVERYNEILGARRALIDWRKVIRDGWDAVEITPHRDEMVDGRHSWYVSWSVASGVIFRPDVTVAEMQLIEDCYWEDSEFLEKRREA